MAKEKTSTSMSTNPTDKQTVEDLVDEMLPLAVPNYNMGLLPDEPGYNNEFAEMRYHSEQKREYFKAQFNQLLIKEQEKSNKSVEAVKYMISVWDEVTPSWRDTPDHVKKKFIEAENQLGENKGENI